jgi:hypothetical protein
VNTESDAERILFNSIFPDFERIATDGDCLVSWTAGQSNGDVKAKIWEDNNVGNFNNAFILRIQA